MFTQILTDKNNACAILDGHRTKNIEDLEAQAEATSAKLEGLGGLDIAKLKQVKNSEISVLMHAFLEEHIKDDKNKIKKASARKLKEILEKARSGVMVNHDLMKKIVSNPKKEKTDKLPEFVRIAFEWITCA